MLTDKLINNGALKLRLVITAVMILLAIGYVSWLPYLTGKANSEQLSKVGFSLQNVDSHLDYIANLQRSPGMPGHRKAQNYIMEQLQANGLEPVIQRATVQSSRLTWMGLVANIENIVARVKGSGDGDAILFVGHYDSVINSLGANDNAVAVSILLELSRLYATENRITNDLIFLFTDGEEAGLLGAEAFIEKHAYAKEVKFIVNLEARGNSGPSLLFESNGRNADLIAKMKQGSDTLISSSIFHEIYKVLPNDTDFTVLKRTGAAGLNFAYIEGLSHYHSMNDNRASVDPSSVAHHSSNVVTAAREFGDISLSPLSQQHKVYFNFPFVGVIEYSNSLVIPLNLFALVIVALLIRFAISKTTVTGKSVALPLVINTFGAGVIITTVYFLNNWVTALSPSFKWSFLGAHELSHWYVISFLLFGIAFLMPVFRWCFQKFGLTAVYLAGLSWMLLLSLATAFIAQGANYLFFWPLVFGLSGCSYLLLKRFDKSPDHRDLLFSGAISALGLLFIFPVAKLIFAAMELNALPVVLVLTFITMWLTCPLMYIVTIAYQNKLPGTVLILSILSLIVLNTTYSFSPQYPKSQSLAYLYDSDASEGYWLSIDQNFDDWSRGIFGPSPAKASMPKYFGAMNFPFVFKKSAEVPTMSSPEFESSSLDTSKGLCKFTFNFRSRMNADQVWVSIPVDRKVIGAEINGQPIRTAYSATSAWTVRYIGLGNHPLKVTMELEGNQPVQITMLEHVPGLQPIGALKTSPRPDYSMSPPVMDHFENATFQSSKFEHQCD